MLCVCVQEGEAGLVHHPDFLRQGLLYVHDSSKKGAVFLRACDVHVTPSPPPPSPPPPSPIAVVCAVPLGGSWHRYFCQFRKTDIAGKKIRQLRLLPLRDHKGPVGVACGRGFVSLVCGSSIASAIMYNSALVDLMAFP